MASEHKPPGHLSRTYIVLLVALLYGALLATVLTEIYVPYTLGLWTVLLLVLGLGVSVWGSLWLAGREFKQTLEQQTATSEILRVISSSPTDVQPVFDTIVRNAMQLCAGHQVVLIGLAGEMLTFRADQNYRPEGEAEVRAALPRRATRDTASGRAILERLIVRVPVQ